MFEKNINKKMSIMPNEKPQLLEFVEKTFFHNFEYFSCCQFNTFVTEWFPCHNVHHSQVVSAANSSAVCLCKR